MDTEDRMELAGRRAGDAADATSKTLTDPIDAMLDALIDAFVGWQSIVSSIGLSILGGITVILWILALSSYRIFGFVLDAKSYAISTTVASILLTIVFFTTLTFLILKVRRIKRLKEARDS